MNYRFSNILIGLTCFLSFVSDAFSQSQLETSNTYVKVINPIYNLSSELTLVVNGEIVCTGDCSAKPAFGLIKKNENNRWDTLFDVTTMGQFLCGPRKYTWENDTLRQSFFSSSAYSPITKQPINTSGIYRLTFLHYKKGSNVFMFSNEFEINVPLPPKKNPQELTGYLDTIKAGDFYFIHYRAFNFYFGKHTEVWHRIRVTKSLTRADYIFDKIFLYKVPSFNNFPYAFVTSDFNRDGWVDFKIMTNGGYQYYLYNWVNSTFESNYIFNSATSFTTDTTKNNLSVYLRNNMIQDGAYTEEYTINYTLPQLNFISAKKLLRNGNTGDSWEQADSTSIIFPVSITVEGIPTAVFDTTGKFARTKWSQYPQPEIKDAPYVTAPFIEPNKKHYFPTDTVFLIYNKVGFLNDLSQLKFVIEVFENNTKTWKPYQYSPLYLEDYKEIKLDNGYKIKVDCINYTINLELGFMSLWTGIYRINVLQNEKEMLQTQEFYVHD